MVGEGLALDIVDAFLIARFEGGRHATRVEMIEAVLKYPSWSSQFREPLKNLGMFA